MDTFSEHRSDAIRTILEAQVTTDGTQPWRRHRWLVAAALVVGGALAGTGVSAAAFAISTSSSTEPDRTAVAAPPGVIPGQPIISVLGDPASQQTSGDTDIPLEAAPPAATHVRVTVVCLTPGATSWGFDPGGNNPSSSCDEADVLSASPGAWFDFPLSPTTTTLFLRSSADTRVVVTYQYLNYVPTALGVNDRGETYGASAHDSGQQPDLVAVSGLSPTGEPVDGYVRASELDSFGPDWPDQPSTPDEALEWQAQRDESYPHGWDLTVYASDGTTVIGTFHVGN